MMEWQICCELRRRGVSTPILMLTGSFVDVGQGDRFEAGADDYLAKPFDLEELRRAYTQAAALMQSSEAAVLRFADIEMNRVARTVTAPGSR